jgi:hypothetical protein
MHVSIVMAHAEDQLRSTRISCYADDGTVSSAIPLDLHPVASPSRVVAAIRPFRHHTLDRPKQREPLASGVVAAGLLHHLHAGMRVLSHDVLEPGASRRQWFIDEADTTDLKCIEGHENGRLLPGCTGYVFSRNRQPRL